MSIGVGIIGLGTVGSGTVEILEERIPFFVSELGLDIEIRGLCAKSDAETAPFAARGHRCTTNAQELIDDPSIQILVELVGGYDLPRKWISAALAAGKNVVTANKALIAKHGAELFPIAAQNKVDLLFEAAVGGGIPVIRAMQESLVGCEIKAIRGIVNGTCNSILPSMFKDGGDFDAVLAEAQKLGYAEANPTFDVDAIDSAHKLAILASLASGKFVDFQKMLVEGIRGIGQIDVRMAREMGCTIKLLGIFNRCEDGRIDARVHPCLLPENHLLSSVDGVLNAVHLEATNLGPTLMTGAGAGKLPTASAVVGDVVAIARKIASGGAPLPMGFFREDNAADLLPRDEIRNGYYLRFTMRDRAGVLAAITQAFKEAGISVASMIQKHSTKGGEATIIFTTHKCAESAVQAAIAAVDGLEDSVEPAKMIRFG